jgi:hypothetical protein
MRIFDTFIVAEISHEFEQSTKITYILRKVYSLEIGYIIERGLELTLISRKEFKELESNYMDFLRINERHTS